MEGRGGTGRAVFFFKYFCKGEGKVEGEGGGGKKKIMDDGIPSLAKFVKILDDMRDVEEAKAQPNDRNAANLCISIVNAVPNNEKERFRLAFRKALFKCTPWNPAAWRLAHKEMGMALHNLIGNTRPHYLSKIIAIIHNR